MAQSTELLQHARLTTQQSASHYRIACCAQAGALGVSQHHDAITSSQRRHVHRDYIKQLSIGQAAVDSSVCRVVAATIAKPGGPPPTLVTCPYLNESSCPAAEHALAGESWLTAAVPMDNPSCSCKLTRVCPHQPSPPAPAAAWRWCCRTRPATRWCAHHNMDNLPTRWP